MEMLESYLKQIQRYPLLDAKQEIELSKLIESGSKAAQEKLVHSNLRLVVSVAKRIGSSSKVSLMDLIQEGNMGLMTAASKYHYSFFILHCGRRPPPLSTSAARGPHLRLLWSARRGRFRPWCARRCRPGRRAGRFRLARAGRWAPRCGSVPTPRRRAVGSRTGPAWRGGRARRRRFRPRGAPAGDFPPAGTGK